MTNTNEYWKKRNRDMIIEQNCAAYADKYFFDKMRRYSYERIPWDDEESKTRQIRGEDLIVHRDNLPDMIIDEKAKVGGMINKVIKYPSFEILCKTQYLTRHFESWFVSPKNTTTHYAMISIASDKDEKNFLSGDINCMVYALIPVKPLKNWIEEETGKTMDEIKQDAWDLLTEYQNIPYPSKNDGVKVYKSDLFGKFIHMKVTPEWKNSSQPVNLVIRRDYLRINHLINEIYFDNEKVKHPYPYISGTDDLARL